jgi:hypothetical protein
MDMDLEESPMTWMEPGLGLPEIPEGWREWTVEDELRHELQQAIYTIQFLHDCLTDPHIEGTPGGSTYAYPEMTLERLKRWEPLVADAPRCSAGHMSFHKPEQLPCPVHHRLMPK